MAIHYIIIDDDDINQYDLTINLEKYRGFVCDGIFPNIQTAIAFLNDHETNIVFIKYSMGDSRYSGDALFMCSCWNQTNPDMMTVVYGDDESQCYNAIRFGAASFFTVPIDETIFQGVISRITYRYELLEYKIHANNRLVMIKTKDGYQLIERDSILFVERINRKNRLITTSGKEVWLGSYTMDELEALLSKCGFYRCYQSYIVNLEKVVRVSVNSEKKYYMLGFDNYDGEILLSREKYSKVLDVLKEKYSNVFL